MVLIAVEDASDDDDDQHGPGKDACLADLPECILSSIYSRVPPSRLSQHRGVCSKFRMLCPAGPMHSPVRLRLRYDTGRAADVVPALPQFLCRLGADMDVELSVHGYCSANSQTHPFNVYCRMFDTVLDAVSERGLTQLTSLSIYADASTRTWALPYETIAAIIACNTRLTDLCICGIPLEERGLRLLSEAFTITGVKLRSLNLQLASSQRKLAVDALSPLLTASSLTSLQFADTDLSGERSAELARSLSSPYHLRSLKLKACNLGIKDIVLLGPAIHSDLTDLDISQNKIGPPGLSSLAPSFRNLTHLDLSYNFSGTEGLAALAPYLPWLTRLQTLLMAAYTVSVLEVGDAPVINGDGGAGDAQEEARLMLRALRTFLEAMVDLTGRAPNVMTRLDLSHIPLGNAGLGWLRGFGGHRSLETLRLDSTRLGTRGAMGLALGVEFLSSLRHLSVANNLVLKEGILALARALVAAAAPLQTFYLQGNKIGALGAICLASVLPCLTSLQRIDISSNVLGVSGANAVCASLLAHPHLLTVRMKDNSLGTFSRQITAEARNSLCLSSPCLTTLDLE